MCCHLPRTRVDEPMAASERVERDWDGTDDRGANVASGVYFCKIVAGDRPLIRKMALVR